MDNKNKQAFKSDFWRKVECLLGEEIPPCVIRILDEVGFNTMISISDIQETDIDFIEKCVNQELRHIFDDLNCCNSETYKKQQEFHVLPGHRKVILKLKNCGKDAKPVQTQQYHSPVSSEFSFLLKKLIETAEQNANKVATQHRYPEVIRWFAIYVYMTCGKMCYETLCRNLPLPQPSSILQYISQSKSKVVEGDFRGEGLLKYIEKINAPKRVWISEDATGIVPRVEFDPKTNQLVGLVLPTNNITGMPVPFTFLARSAETIEMHVNKPRSALVYFVMAQPLMENVPPYVLLLFGTDNKFKTKTVLQRWKFIIQKLKKLHIDVDGFSSDGDTRLLSAMRSEMQLSEQSLFGDVHHILSYVQDTIHEVLKLRSKLVKVSVHLPMGNKQVSVSHLKMLINIASKDVHGLVLKDICPDDKQNFRSLIKCMQPRVLQALKTNVADSQATILYLRLCSYIESAMNDLDMIPVERIRRMWFAIYYLRIWRKWVINSSKNKNSSAKYTLSDNWITPNAYQCIEINGHSLVHMMRKLRDTNEDNLFLPFLFNSQTCEQAFRQLRSMTTLNWTKVNFSILELTHMIGRLELQNEIIYFKLSDVGIEFPRIARNSGSFKHYPLPTDHEIKIAIELAKNEAVAEAHKFDMNVRASEITKCELPNINCEYDEPTLEELESDDEIIHNGHIIDPFDFDDDEALSGILEQNLCLKDYSDGVDLVNEESRFTKVTDKSGASKVVRKSSVVWVLSNSNKETLSSDRLQRVKGQQTTSRRRLNFQPVNAMAGRVVYLSDELCLGQWCFFENPDDLKRSKKSDDIRKYMVGAITSFKYSTGKTEKQKQYSWDFAPITNNNIQVLATWYEIQPNGEFVCLPNKSSFYVPMKNYLMSMEPPLFESNNDSEKCNIYLQEATNAIIRINFTKLLQSKQNKH